MPHDAQQYHSQRFEHIIATIFTCRSIVRYNLTLTPEQKDELLRDIDTSLEALRSLLITPSSQAAEDTSVRPQPNLSTSSETDALESKETQGEISIEKQTLHSLYRMYHAYMDEKQSSNMYAFMKRFNEVMTAITDIQRNISPMAGSRSLQDLIEHSLQQLQMFVSDMYYIFMEFIRVLSDLLQQNDVYLNTDEISPLSSRAGALAPLEGRKDPEHDLTILFQAYMAHQQLDRLKGNFSSRVHEVTAFLNFLKQNVMDTTNGREELIMRLNYTTNLLDDMARLLIEYEKAASALL